MRKIALAIAAASAMMVVSAPAFAQYNRADPGCSTSIGGNCGHQLDMQNNTWRRLHLPLEPGVGARQVYGNPMPQQRVYGGVPQVYGGVPQQRIYGGVPQGYGQGQVIQGPVVQGSVTVLVPHPWRRMLTPNGWVCMEGPCPNDRVYVGQ